MQSQAPAETTSGQAATTGLGEDINFLTAENHIFLNKLNYICKNYDQSFKDVSKGLVQFIG